MTKRALGIDHGEARIGLAMSDQLNMLAHPLETLDARKKPVDRIVALVAEHDIGIIILGLPRNMDGSSGPAAEKARAFAKELEERVPCPIRLWDERLTSVAAQRALHDSGRNVKESRKVIDQVAALMILQSYLDSQALL